MIDKLIDFLVGVLDLFRFWQVLNTYERGVQLRLGRMYRELGPGFHWIRPFRFDVVLLDNVVPRTTTLRTQNLMTSDGRAVGVTGVVTSSIKHIQKALLEVEGVDHALVDACMAGIASHVATTSWADLRTDDLSDRLTKACRAQAFRYGIEIHRVQLADLSPAKAIRLMGVDSRPFGG